MKEMLLSEEYGYLPPVPPAETFSMEKDVVPGLAAREMPSPGEASLEGTVGYHLRKGMHYLSREDWHAAMAFLKMH